MYLINNILLDEEIKDIKFSCDLNKCKGACCTFHGDWGAPVSDGEIEILKESVGVVRKYLSKKSLNTIKKHGVAEGEPGNYSTVCIDKRDCVFVFYENDIAKCSIEHAFFNGEIRFRKPISCHLFPIRVNNNGSEHLYFSYFDECKPAIDKGKKENVPLVDSVREALVRLCGEKWFDEALLYLKDSGAN